MTNTGGQTGGATPLDMLIIGQGFGGMYMLHKARGMGLSVRAIEAGDNVGGVWYWNRYPGARCDVMSIDYCYSFSNEIMQDWTWSEQFAAQPEILAYANYVADKLDLRRDVLFNTRATTMRYDDARALWRVETEGGEVFEVTYLVMATGPLSVPKGIDVPGAERFGGELYLSGRWPHHTVDFAGKRVGVIGTGSTGIQIVPVVAQQAQALTVFQRTPSFTLPMRNRKLDAGYVAQIKEHYPQLRALARNSFTGGVRAITSRPLFSVSVAERERLMSDAWDRGGLEFLGLFSDLLFNQQANDIVADFVRRKIAETVHDPETAATLTPHGYPIFARRPCLDSGYYETFNRDNVTLVDCLTDPIQEITATGIRTATAHIDLDVIIGATGYDGLTGAMMAVDITGRDGRSLREKWAGGAQSYLGLMMAGFPNLFMIAGANGPSALANFVLLNEQNADWICDCIDHLRAHALPGIEPRPEAESAYMHTVVAIAEQSLMPKANTWYTGTNIAGKPRFFPIFAGGLNKYREMCADEVANGFPGFVTTRADADA
ncbi:flavin-containing monooxygenase [Pararhodobacter zhoushanensis]|uniref:NAD(P)/FAD-dependent oxidoreductase n=1 Tax=Pararhodobacter zhoushanensis TaxID=2479545 RepID=A0ABT3H185_9RHOB|nr:NAD(P)/FAD-dependent oxidoreductase [Pararhodobacter zhoushanensis]MCW1933567.1 NAD(P)/FAD-dependent oxidoreductase [Pararhodobacter zhoushanensis]